ncbi:MAG: hypothetical protein COA43_12940 [Robiginitomaculum sp.]|nr:MAG: hypothetical protein COA43_12940 [Robiginitomaculum sp.]
MIWRQMLGYIPVNVANIIVSFGTIAILTRLFDGAEFGRYAIAVASLHFIHMALFTWVEAAMSRFYANAESKGKTDLASHMKTLYGLSILAGVIGLPLLLGAVYLLPIDTHMKMLLAFSLGSTCLTLVFNIAIESHKAAERIGRFSVIFTSNSLLGFSVGIILILMTPLREVAPFIGIIFANIISIIIDLPFMLKRMKGGKFETENVRKYLNYGVPISLSLMLTYILSQGDLFFIQHFMGDVSVGQYNAGYNLANRSLDVLFVWLGMAVTPVAIAAFEHDGIEKTQQVLKNYGATLLLLILPAATGIALVAEPAGFILGESVRAEAVKIMPWIAFAGVMNGFISYYAQRAFMLSKNTGVLAVTMIVPVLINIVLNLLLIPRYELLGAVWATMAAYGVGLVLSFIIARRYFPLPLPLKALVQCSFACAVMAGVVLALPSHIDAWPDVIELLTKAGIGAIAYAATAYAINASDCRDTVQDLRDKLKSRAASKTVQT